MFPFPLLLPTSCHSSLPLPLLMSSPLPMSALLTPCALFKLLLTSPCLYLSFLMSSAFTHAPSTMATVSCPCASLMPPLVSPSLLSPLSSTSVFCSLLYPLSLAFTHGSYRRFCLYPSPASLHTVFTLSARPFSALFLLRSPPPRCRLLSYFIFYSFTHFKSPAIKLFMTGQTFELPRLGEPLSAARCGRLCGLSYRLHFGFPLITHTLTYIYLCVYIYILLQSRLPRARKRREKKKNW